MDVREFTITTPEGQMGMTEARNKARDRAAVIVLHEMTGVNPHIKDVMQRVNAAGYHAVVPHLFHRTGDQTFPYGDHEPIMEQVGRLHDKEFVVDLQATLDYLHAEGWASESIGAVGFCIGGRVSFLLAGTWNIGAAVTFYGGGVAAAAEGYEEALPALLPLANEMRTPWLGLYGDSDGGIPVSQVEQIREALAGKEADIKIYEGAGHAFHCDPRPEYVPSAARDGWKRTLEWFENHLTLVGP